MIPSVTSIHPNFPFGTFFVLLIVYAFFGFSLAALARKTGFDAKAWWAWIPVLQVILLLQIAGLEWWWIFFLLIPFVNIAVGIYAWIKVAKALHKHPIWGILIIVPVVNIAVLAYLAFSKPSSGAQ